MFGGMDVSLMSRMKELEDENRRLKKLYVDAQLSADLLREALAKKRFFTEFRGKCVTAGAG
jgi:putative transposase